MSNAPIVANWFKVGRDLYFRKIDIYSMEWDQEIKLEYFIVASASYGGPLALRRDDRKLIKVRGTVQPSISIFSQSGRSITSFKWCHRPIVYMGWSNEEELICIQDDGNVIIYDMFGNLVHKFNVFQKVHDTRIVDARVFTNAKNVTGLAVMVSNFNIFVVNSIKDIRSRQLSDIPRTAPEPTCWEAVSKESSTEVLLAKGRELYRLKQDDQSTMLQPDVTNPYTAILEMSVSLNARHLCFFTDSGLLWLGSTDLRHKYCEIETNYFHRPRQLVWCGNETIVAYWVFPGLDHQRAEHTVMVVGKNGQSETMTYDSAVHLAAEIDGVRIISSTNHELLQKVPDATQKIFQLNSTEPGSFLMEASKQFQKGSHKANEFLTHIKANLVEAVNQCLDAVGYEFDLEVQKRVIRAAQFGKCFVSGMSSDNYVKMCRLLRVLNAVRDPKVGIPLTIEQLKYMNLKELNASEENASFKSLLDRLIVRNMYYLALQIAKYLKLPENVGCSYILVHWAKYKVGQHHVDEETVAREIAEKLGYSSGISYREIAEKASEYGKKKLAIKLLDFEPKASEQVELLLTLGENKTALHKAIESGDTDLVYMVILKLREKMPLADFKMTIRTFPVAQALYIKYCKEHNKSALTEIYIQEDDHVSQAQLMIEECLDGDQKMHLRDSLLTTAIEAYKRGRKDLYANICEENLRLLKFQRELENKLQAENTLVGKSVHDTCKALLEMKELKLAEKVKNDFKIPDKRYWWLKVIAVANENNWTELDKLAKLKKSPIGYAPFVDACLANNKKDEAIKYLPKVTEDGKIRNYLRLGLFDEVARTALQQRDIQSLVNMQHKFSQPEFRSQSEHLLQTVSGMLNQLNYKK